MVLGVVGLFFSTADIAGQSTGAPPSGVASSQSTTQAHPGSQAADVEILSGTRGVDFGPYLKRTLQMIKEMWLPLIPEEARPPYNLQSDTLIRFTINPDGRIGAMHLDGGDHQVKFDRAAWGAIIGVGQFPPLPTNFSGPGLELRIHFRVNTRQQ